MSNFQFLHNDWPGFLEQAKTIEENVNAEPRYSCFMVAPAGARGKLDV